MNTRYTFENIYGTLWSVVSDEGLDFVLAEYTRDGDLLVSTTYVGENA